MIIVRERKDGRWRSLSRTDVEDVTEEVSLRGRLEGVFTWAMKRIGVDGYIRIEIEDKATLRVRRFKDACALSGSVRPSSASMFESSKDRQHQLDSYFTRALSRLPECDPVDVKDSGMEFRMTKKDRRRIEFIFLVSKERILKKG